MIESRIKAIRGALTEEGVDALLMTNLEDSGQPNTRYVSGFSGSHSYTLITQKQLWLITDGRYFSQVAEEASHFTLVKLGAMPVAEVIAKSLAAAHVRTLLIDSERTSYELMQRMKKRFGGIKVIPHSGLLHQLRIVKDKSELKLLAKAADISCTAFNKLLPFIKPGITERQVAQRLEYLMQELGADKIAFETIVASGSNGAKPHAQVTDKKIKTGELVTIDFGASYRGYLADMTRTVAIGKVSPKLLEMYDVVQKAQQLGCASAKAGITGKALDTICRQYIEKRGYGTYFLHSTGHGLGMEVHELPYVSPANVKPLPEGSVVTCEPGVYIEGVGGVRIEDALVLTKSGNINLNQIAPKKLIVL